VLEVLNNNNNNIELVVCVDEESYYLGKHQAMEYTHQSIALTASYRPVRCLFCMFATLDSPHAPDNDLGLRNREDFR